MTEEISTESRDYWFKIVEFLQQNWALVYPHEREAIACSSEIPRASSIRLSSRRLRKRSGLTRNGIRRFADDPKAQTFLLPPEPPFTRWARPNDPIYSSGRFWR
jgi:hypothetical protein